MKIYVKDFRFLNFHHLVIERSRRHDIVNIFLGLRGRCGLNQVDYALTLLLSRFFIKRDERKFGLIILVVSLFV